jgi:hypothetical protein
MIREDFRLDNYSQDWVASAFRYFDFWLNALVVAADGR